MLGEKSILYDYIMWLKEFQEKNYHSIQINFHFTINFVACLAIELNSVVFHNISFNLQTPTG